MRNRGLWLSLVVCLLMGIATVGRNADPQMLGALSNGSPNGIALSADGTMLAVATALGIELRVAGDWTIERFLTDNEGAVTSVAFSPDGEYLAAGSRDETARIWRVETGELLHTLPHENRYVTAVAFSADGTMLATGADSAQVCLWNPETGESLGCLTFPGMEVEAHMEVERLVFSQAGRTLAAELAGDMFSGVICGADLSSGELLGKFLNRSGSLRLIGFSDGEESIMGMQHDGTIQFYDIEAVRPHAISFEKDFDTYRVADVVIDPTRTWLAIGMDDGRLFLRDRRCKDKEWSLDGHMGEITAIAFSGDGATMATAGEDCRVRIWDTASRTVLHEVRDYAGINTSVSISPDGRYLICEVSDDGLLDVWDLATKKNLRSLEVTPLESIARPLAVSPDGEWVAAGTRSRRPEGAVDVLRIADGERVFSSEAPDPDVGAVAFSPDGGRLAIASCRSPENEEMVWDASIQVVGTKSGDPIWTAENDYSEPHFVLFGCDGELVVANAASTLGVWSSEDGELLRTFGEAARAAMLSPNGSILNTATWTGDAVITARYRLQTGELLERYVHKVSGMISVAFSPGGALVAVGTLHGLIYVWSTESGDLIDEFEPYFGTGEWPTYWELARLLFSSSERLLNWPFPFSLVFSPDGGTLVAGLMDGTILRWGIDSRGASDEGE